MSRRIVVFVLGIALLAGVPRPAQAGERRAERVGLLIADHGEPPEYNQFTYWSFREFIRHLVEMGFIPFWLTVHDAGTILQDQSCYACESPSSDPDFIDAWLRPHAGPAAFVRGSSSLPSHYVVPGGPGLGEPDFYEIVGLAAWNEWQQMGGRSPNYDQKLTKKKAVIRRLARSFPDVPVRVGYGIDPRLGGGHQGLRGAVNRLINADRVDHIVVAYHGVGFSDVMQTHMIRHEVKELSGHFDPDVTVSFAKPIGTRHSYMEEVAEKVALEVARLPDEAPIAIHLSGHGLPLDRCGDYECAGDRYHRFSSRLFGAARAAIKRRVAHDGKLGVFHLYGDGATADADPDDKMDSPMEALAKRKEAGFDYVIDVPYEFDSDSRDTLIILRHGYERDVPDWDHRFESRFAYDGMRVKITNASFGARGKTQALYEVVRNALRDQSGSRHAHR
jgi:hypothetical protein